MPCNQTSPARKEMPHAYDVCWRDTISRLRRHDCRRLSLVAETRWAIQVATSWRQTRQLRGRSEARKAEQVATSSTSWQQAPDLGNRSEIKRMHPLRLWCTLHLKEAAVTMYLNAQSQLAPCSYTFSRVDVSILYRAIL